MDSEETLIELRREYPDPIDDVWSALTESDRTARWIGTWTGEPGVGNTIMLLMTAEEGSEPAPGVIRECDPPKRLVMDLENPSEPTTWRVELTLTPQGSGTVLDFVHRMPKPDWDTSDIAKGWHFYLDRLGAALSDEPVPEWDGYTPPSLEA
ncbi:SRPBCC family protein [Amycolatopsis pittospori]|uniref:SRPBCC family protein n=1 Tax=Amycolatopsis pittospori TaxID=2749434 RepID=UPI0015F0503F|nr:SRPBCC family protein [Amycolatopsis pittospori]